MYLVLLSLVVVVLGQERKCKPPELENGVVNYEEGMGDSYTSHFRCNPGFRLSGPKMVKCRDGVGIKKMPVCTATGCDVRKLPRIKNGKRYSSRSSRDSVFKYRCNKGFKIYGTKLAHCTQNGWSLKQVPVCVKTGCDSTQLLSQDVDSGWNNVITSPKLLGAVFRFRCAKNARLEGDPFVYCDGIEWSGTKPQCLVPPTVPSLSVEFPWGQMNGTQWNPESDVADLAVGQALSLVCRAEGGNPRPMLSFLLNGEKQEAESVTREEKEDTASWSFVTDKYHQEVSCVAENKAAVSPVSSNRLMFNILYSPMDAYIHGPESVIYGEQGVMFLEEDEWKEVGEEGLKFSCSSDSSNPASSLSVTITDQTTGKVIQPSKEIPLPKMKLANGFASRIEFNIQVDPSWGRELLVECLAYNLQGSSKSNMTVDILYPPGPVDILGDKWLIPNSRPVYTCRSSSPQSRLSWRVEGSDGRQVSEYHVVEGEEEGLAVSVLELDQTDEILELECTASNMAGHSSDKLVVTPADPISGVNILGGPEKIEVWSDLYLDCSSPLSNPQQDLSWSLTDQSGNSLEFHQYDTVEEDGVLYSSIIYQPNDVGVVNAVCTASNQVGYVETSYRTTITGPIVQMEPKWLDGHTFDIGDSVEVTCSSPSEIHQDAQIHWFLNRQHAGSNEHTFMLDIHDETSSLECVVYWEDFTEGASAHFSVNIPTTLPPVETTIYDYVETTTPEIFSEYDFGETTTKDTYEYGETTTQVVSVANVYEDNSYEEGEREYEYEKTSSQEEELEYEYKEVTTKEEDYKDENRETIANAEHAGKYDYGETTTKGRVSDYEYGENAAYGYENDYDYDENATLSYEDDYENNKSIAEGEEYVFEDTTSENENGDYEKENNTSDEEASEYGYEVTTLQGEEGLDIIEETTSQGEYSYEESAPLEEEGEYSYEGTTLQVEEGRYTYEATTPQGEDGEYETTTQGEESIYEYEETTSQGDDSKYEYEEYSSQKEKNENEYEEYVTENKKGGEYEYEEYTSQKDKEGYAHTSQEEKDDYDYEGDAVENEYGGIQTNGDDGRYPNEETTLRDGNLEYKNDESVSQGEEGKYEYEEYESGLEGDEFEKTTSQWEKDEYENEESTSQREAGELGIEETTPQENVSEHEYEETGIIGDEEDYKYEDTAPQEDVGKYKYGKFKNQASEEKRYNEDYGHYSNKDEEIDAVDTKRFEESTKHTDVVDKKEEKFVYDPFIPQEDFLKPENEVEEKASHVDSTSMAVENLFIPKKLASQSKSTYLHQSNNLLILLLVTIPYLTHILNNV